MAEPSILRETKIGQKGYVKEDVMTYIDELNSKIVSLEGEIKKGAPATPVDQQEIIKYRNQIDNLQEKLNASNNALRAAKKEVEELQQQHDSDLKIIEQLKAGGPGAASAAAQSNAQTAAALEAAKKEIDKLNAQLKEAQAKAAAPQAAPQQNAQNAQAVAALEAAKKEIDRLNAQLKEAQAKAAAPAPAEQAANNAEIAKVKQEIARLTSELGNKSKEIAERDNTIDQITKDKENAAAQLKSKDDEIAKLNGEIISLKEAANDPTAQMGLIFAEAQKTVNMLKTQAKADAEKTVSEATEKAEAILSEANAKAEKTISEANVTAEACINEANDQAKSTVENANKHADKVNEMSSSVRAILLKEIESVNTKFNDISSVLNRLTSQATDRMSEAQLIIGDAKKSISSAEGIQKAEAPKADFKASEAPKASLSDIGKEAPSASSDAKNGDKYDPFASIGSAGSYASKNPAYNNNSKPAAPAHSSAPAPAPAPKQNAAPKKNNFGFDMEALLKAAEEEAAKNPEE